MSDRWYSPDEHWPAHPKPWWRDALSEARKANWHLVVFAGHCWGEVVCGRVGSGRCEKLIFSTARAGESHAKDLIRLIRRCHHAGLEGGGLVEASRLLDGAQLLLDAAESCLEADADFAAAEDLLEMALGNVTVAEALMKDGARTVADAAALLDEAVELESKAHAEMAEARARAATAGFSASVLATAPNLVGEAAERIDTAAVMVGPRSSAGTGALHDRIKALRERVENLRSRLAKT